MEKALIITEKPSVAQEFARILGVSGRNDGYIENQDYVITWCVGHLVEMVYPEEYDIRYKKWKLEDLPFLPKDYKYDIIPAVSKQYDVVHRMLHREDIGKVYWAGDAGKEGQTIEENIRRFGGVRDGMEELRVWIDSQTEEEILRGIREAKPMSDYDNLANSGIMRTIEDYAMGINFSRAMSVKYGQLLNDAAGTKSYTAIAVGRVMTCVLGMVVIREREIRNFVETPFYRVVGDFTASSIQGEWKAAEGSKYVASPLLYKENGFKKKESALQLIEELQGQPARVKSVEKNMSNKRAPLLFNLAELQAECSKRFKISPDETLQVAQDLYEKKLTTYPRTDARVLSSAVAKEIGKNVSGLKKYEPVATFAEHIMNDGSYRGIAQTSYTDDSKITDHYAIIPTGQLTELKSLNELQRKVFDLIARRFLSIFYPPAKYQNIKLTIHVGKEPFYAGAKVLKEAGYLEVMGKSAEPPKDETEGDEEKEEKKDPKVLLALAETLKAGDEIPVNGYEIKEGKTSPPKRYTSGSMVLAMENAGQLIEEEELREQIKGSGIGTSATRAEIIKKLVRIGYLNLNKKTQVLTPETLGEMVYEVVDLTVPQLLNPKMTASWEKGLDGITKGTVQMDDYRGKLEEFIRKETVSMIERDLKNTIAERIRPMAGKNAKDMKARVSIGVKCPVCGGDLVTTPFGYGCGNYQKDGSGCRFVIGSIAGRDLSDEEVKQLIETGRTPVLNGFTSKSNKKFKAALVMECDEQNQVHISFDFSDNEPDVVEGVQCPLCGGDVVKVPFGYACTNRRQEDPESCSFAIGKIAGKDLTVTHVKNLLTTGSTGTIRGFTSKAKKKFDACLVLAEDENGKKSIKFDFDHVEAKKLRDVVCPLCGGDLIQTPFGYGCANYDREREDSCRFSIGKIAGVKLKDSQIKQLLLTKKTDPIAGFVSKSGKKFEAPLKLTEDGRIQFDFPERPKPEETPWKCPKCGKMLMKSQWKYECECGFRIGRVVAKLELPMEVVGELLEKKQSSEMVKGFTSKAGKSFDAYLKLTEDGIQFDFDRKPPAKPNPQNSQTQSSSQKVYEESTYAPLPPAPREEFPTVSGAEDSEAAWEALLNGAVEEEETDVPDDFHRLFE
ncbi:MAG: DNA topoisomerase [Lachnospiraceae bacterium]|nr:DNA topoisomerase [Lachnospiraceae bacterium]